MQPSVHIGNLMLELDRFPRNLEDEEEQGLRQGQTSEKISATRQARRGPSLAPWGWAACPPSRPRAEAVPPGQTPKSGQFAATSY